MDEFIIGDKNQVARRKEIMSLLQERDEIKVQELSALFKVSPVTIRKDFEILEKRGLIKRVHGGARRVSQIRQRLDSEERRMYRSEEKKIVAKAAAKLINEGDSVLLNVGSTSAFLCDEIKCKKNHISGTFIVCFNDNCMRFCSRGGAPRPVGLQNQR